jgi:hypothetical protein
MAVAIQREGHGRLPSVDRESVGVDPSLEPRADRSAALVVNAKDEAMPARLSAGFQEPQPPEHYAQSRPTGQVPILFVGDPVPSGSESVKELGQSQRSVAVHVEQT